MKILVVEDEPRMLQLLVRGLTEEGHAVDVIDDLSESLDSEPRFAKLSGQPQPAEPVAFDVDTDA